jgi:hypothetical protein
MSSNPTREILAVLRQDRLPHDRRQSPRVPLTVPAWIWRQETSEPIAVRLFDESERGTGFLSPEPLKPGERFELALGRQGVRRTSLRVKYCEPADADTFRIGAEA